jgi:N-acyl-D-amino-acid deacylase
VRRFRTRPATGRWSRRQFLGCGLAAGLALVRGGRAPAGLPADPAAPLPVTGADAPGLASFDDLMRSFVREQRVPGAALAVVRGRRLVYARGFGHADVDRNVPVEPDALFRIASVTKPVTAVAVLHLAEQGKLGLPDRVTDLLPVTPFLNDGDRVDPRLKDVTVLQLLRHTGGWDRDRSGDPMMRPVAIANALRVPPPAGPEQVIRYTFGRPLDFDPGSRFAYSNFGYCVLGEIVRHVSGRSYEEYVRQEVLRPLGIKRMRLGKTLEQAPGEVRYYDEQDRTGPAVVGPVGKQGPLPYGSFYLEAMQAHGGWVASAIDLVRFAAALDDPRRCPVLKPAGFQALYARPPGQAGFGDDGKPKDAYYGCGWQVRVLPGSGLGNTWHNGALPGTSALLVRRFDGLDWAVLFNTRHGPGGKELCDLIDPLLHQAADRVRAWPRHDLFPKYG